MPGYGTVQEAMWPYPKHLKHFLLEDLIGDLKVEVEGLESLGLKEESLEGSFEKAFLFFQELL